MRMRDRARTPSRDCPCAPAAEPCEASTGAVFGCGLYCLLSGAQQGGSCPPSSQVPPSVFALSPFRSALSPSDKSGVRRGRRADVGPGVAMRRCAALRCGDPPVHATLDPGESLRCSPSVNRCARARLATTVQGTWPPRVAGHSTLERG